MFVNEQKGKDKESFKNSLKQCVQSRYHPIGCDTIVSVFDYEVAHVIDNVLQLKLNIEMRELFHKYSRQEIEQGLSKYAIEENKIEEFIAVGWAEDCNNPNPRKIVIEIGKIIEKGDKIMFCCPEPMNEEEFVQRLREEFEYTEEEIAFELKRIKKIIKEKNLTSIEDIECTYGEMFISLTVDKYYKSQKSDYFDKLAEQVQKEIETDLKL